jgi:hypothetical protein
MTETIHGAEQPVNPEVHFEAKDANTRNILITGAVMAGTGLVIHLVLWGLFKYWQAEDLQAKRATFPLAAAQRGRPPAEPQLEGIKQIEGMAQRFRPEEKPPPQEYGWVNEKEGIIRVPVEKAMEWIVERKLLPTQATGEGEAPPSRASSGRGQKGEGQ